MPIWLRRFTFNTIKEYYDKEREEQEKQLNKGETLTNKSRLVKPPVTPQPTYTTKASKK